MSKPDTINRYAEYLDLKHPLHMLDESKDPWAVSASLILAAHCTDVAVNKVMAKLLEAFPTPESILKDGVTKEQIVALLPGISHSGNKSDYLKNVAKVLVANNHNFENDLEKITEISGVGRKTGTIVLYRCYGSDQGFPLDTHCLRVFERLGWYSATKPKPLEKELLADFPDGTRNKSHIILTQFGRLICHPKKPKCDECKFAPDCKFAKDAPAVGS